MPGTWCFHGNGMHDRDVSHVFFLFVMNNFAAFLRTFLWYRDFWTCYISSKFDCHIFHNLRVARRGRQKLPHSVPWRPKTSGLNAVKGVQRQSIYKETANLNISKNIKNSLNSWTISWYYQNQRRTLVESESIEASITRVHVIHWCLERLLIFSVLF